VGSACGIGGVSGLDNTKLVHASARPRVRLAAAAQVERLARRCGLPHPARQVTSPAMPAGGIPAAARRRLSLILLQQGAPLGEAPLRATA
jgi:hypothetical protein